MLSVIMLSVIMMNVVAPKHCFFLSGRPSMAFFHFYFKTHQRNLDKLKLLQYHVHRPAGTPQQQLPGVCNIKLFTAVIVAVS